MAGTGTLKNSNWSVNDLSACGTFRFIGTGPDSVSKTKGRYFLNADRSGDAVRLEKYDLSACEAPDSVKKRRNSIFNAVRLEMRGHDRGDIEKFGTGFYRIQTELKDSPEVSLKLESLSGFMRSGLEVISQDAPHPTRREDTPQDTPQDDLAGMSTVKNLLGILNREMTRQEIQTELKLQNRKYLRKSYLQPALKKGLIEMTIPNKPNSKHQKYRLTEKGNQMKSNPNRQLEDGKEKENK